MEGCGAVTVAGHTLSHYATVPYSVGFTGLGFKQSVCVVSLESTWKAVASPQHKMCTPLRYDTICGIALHLTGKAAAL
jgi:hypothetical protein